MKKNLIALLFAVTLFPLTAQATSPTTEPGISDDVYVKLNTLANVLERIRTSYVEDITETEVIENAINGMLTALDPHSSYLNEEDFKGMQEQTRGEFGGLGIEVTMEKGVVKVVSPIEDTPAYEAGVEAGDLIIRIDDKDVQGLSLSDAVDLMRGKVGTDITVKIFRESEKKAFDVTITRAIIKIRPVKSHLEADGIGYLRITTFNEHVESGIKEHLEKMVKENDNKPLTGLVLDLRNNPGGLLNQAVAASDAFLEQGEIVSTKGKIKGQNSRYNARKGDLLNGAPIVVLINGGSASASEIVSGALQDHKRAVVMGSKSFGKGSVQTVIPLPGNTGMRLTTALYYTPSGRSIQAKGIVPDIEIKRVKIEKLEDTDDLYPTEAGLKGHLEVDNGDDKKSSKKDKKKDKKDDKKEGDDKDEKEDRYDYYLDRALGVVKALSIAQQQGK